MPEFLIQSVDLLLIAIIFVGHVKLAIDTSAPPAEVMRNADGRKVKYTCGKVVKYFYLD